ncbi:hypothetical protein LXL04_028886 [Taraxacum kok-saghyz]
MEFWGVEVKPEESLKVEVKNSMILHVTLFLQTHSKDPLKPNTFIKKTKSLCKITIKIPIITFLANIYAFNAMLLVDVSGKSSLCLEVPADTFKRPSKTKYIYKEDKISL